MDINHPRIPRLLLPDGTAVGYLDIRADRPTIAIPYYRESRASYIRGDQGWLPPIVTDLVTLTRHGNDWMLNDASKLDTIKRCRSYSAEPIRRW